MFQSPPKMIFPGINQNINKPHTQITIHHFHNPLVFAWPTTCRGRKVLLLKVVFFTWPTNNGENHDFATPPDAFADWCLKWSHGLYGSFLASTEKQNPETEKRLKKTVEQLLKRFQRIVESFFLNAWRICFFWINSCLLTVFLVMKNGQFQMFRVSFFWSVFKGRGGTETLFLFGFHAKG